MNNPIIRDPPKLDHDQMMFERFGCDSHLRRQGKTERRIVWNLLWHLAENGWKPHHLHDGEEKTRVSNAKEVMELLFNLDDAWVYVRKDDATHWIRFVLGNDVDIISDHSYAEGDADGFLAAMDAFNAEDYA